MYKRKSDIHNPEYIIRYIRLDGRYSTGEKSIKRVFYFKEQVIKHLMYAYENNRVKGIVVIYKLKHTISSVDGNNMDKIVALNQVKKLEKLI